MRYLAIGVNGLIGLVFLVSSVSKVAGRHGFGAFARSVRELRVVPAGLASRVAVLVIGAEFAVWLLLAVPVAATARAGLLVAIGLLVPFAMVAGAAWRRGLRVPCRCFGRGAGTLGPRQVVRNAFLVCVAVIGLVAWTGPGEASAGAAVVSLLAGLLLGTMVTILDDLIELFRPADAGRGSG